MQENDVFDVTNLTATGPSCWGPVQWTALHQMLRGYPLYEASPEKQEALRAYVTGLAGIIPCSICAQHWKTLATTVKTENRKAALKWSIDAHNLVNARLGKRVYTDEEAVAILKKQCPDNRYACTGPSATTPSSSPAWMYGMAVTTAVVMFVAIVCILVAAVTVSLARKTRPAT